MAPARPLAVFDLDGTLADVRHRLPHLARRPKDWAAFFAAVPDDPPIAEGVALARESAQDCDLLYLTGRPERCRADTLAWLAAQGLPAGDLVMRRGTDRRPARVAKPELLARAVGDRLVAVVVDDDEQVCLAYRCAGWPVLHVAWHPADPVLGQVQQREGRT